MWLYPLLMSLGDTHVSRGSCMHDRPMGSNGHYYYYLLCIGNLTKRDVCLQKRRCMNFTVSTVKLKSSSRDYYLNLLSLLNIAKTCKSIQS